MAVINDDLRQKLCIKETTRGTPLYVEAYRKIRSLIVEGYFKKGEKLFSETELAEMMQIGRTSLRTALAILYEDEYLRSYQGKGTFVVYDPPKSPKEEFPKTYLMPRERLEMIFGDVYILHDHLRLNSYDAFIDDILQAAGEEVVFFQRTYSADGKTPALIMQSYFRLSLYPGLDYERPDDAERWMGEFLRSRITHVTFKAVHTLEGTDSQGFNKVPSISANDSGKYTLITQAWRDKEGTPFLFSKDYYNDNVIRFSAALAVQ
jgi:DNA-binding GntR family transcriptional regulator